MNVFVLSTGRCGSMTFARACGHITNYTAGHETRWGIPGADHFAYPPRHIEIDNRLSWFLGRLDAHFGDRAFYVHLMRDRAAVARSFMVRWHSGVIAAYTGELLADRRHRSPWETCLDYCDTVNANIELFLRAKPHAMRFDVERAEEHFARFWEAIAADGDRGAALAEWGIRHNASRAGGGRPGRASRALRKTVRVIRRLPGFLRQA